MPINENTMLQSLNNFEVTEDSMLNNLSNSSNLIGEEDMLKSLTSFTTTDLSDQPNLGIDPNSTANKWDIATDQAGEMFYDGVALLAAKVGADDVDDAYAIANSDLSGLSTEAALEKIMTEAYKAYYGFNFHETWSNYRRTGYPNIQPEDSDGNGLNPGKQVPRRFLYADSESATNSANYEAAVAAQGGALLNVDVWAFQ